MDHHPIVLQQGVQPAAVLELRDQAEVVGQLGPWQADVLRQLAHQQEGAASHLGAQDVDAQHHRGQEGLHQREYGHHGAFPGARLAHQQVAQHRGPKGPEQERTLLALPKATGDVAQRHFRVAVLPYIVVLEPVVEQHYEQRGHNAHHGKRLHTVGGARHGAPSGIAGARMQHVGHHRQQGAGEREEGEDMSELPCPGVLTDVLDGTVHGADGGSEDQKIRRSEDQTISKLRCLSAPIGRPLKEPLKRIVQSNSHPRHSII